MITERIVTFFLMRNYLVRDKVPDILPQSTHIAQPKLEEKKIREGNKNPRQKVIKTSFFD